METKAAATEDLTKKKWISILSALMAVPVKRQTVAWMETVKWIREILSGTNNLAVAVDPAGVHYAVNCALCHKPIHLCDDFVFHALTVTHTHYDCHYRPGAGNQKLKEE